VNRFLTAKRDHAPAFRLEFSRVLGGGSPEPRHDRPCAADIVALGCRDPLALDEAELDKFLRVTPGIKAPVDEAATARPQSLAAVVEDARERTKRVPARNSIAAGLRTPRKAESRRPVPPNGKSVSASRTAARSPARTKPSTGRPTLESPLPQAGVKQTRGNGGKKCGM
jgi:hypothetical protein